ncbi:MAG: type II toxin-antitoxin system HicB family antitoxin [Rickettsiales bacterium]|nr:type II toxin-antitoxin system HicB family antitoxin [Rickettsiales bacterium]
MKNKSYIAFIELKKEPGVDVLGAVFPDFPGCVSVGKTYGEAFCNAHEALALHISGMRADGLDIPPPRTLEQIELGWEDYADWENGKFAVAYIDVLPPSKNKTFTISMDVGLMAEIDARTKNRSAFLATAARQYIGDDKRLMA